MLSALALVGTLAAANLQVPPIEYEEFTLDNGLQFVVHEDHSTPLVAVNVWYDVGSRNEPDRRSGFAHLFEHLLFEETENLAAGDFKDIIRRAGGTYNGTTNEDRTAYFETLPSNRLNLAMWLEAERMARLRVTQENFDREREVVKEERRLRIENQPYSAAVLELGILATDWEPYQHTVIGSMDDLNAATVEDVEQFYRDFYGPENATIVISGDTTVDEVREMANTYFADIPRGEAELPALPPYPEIPRTSGEIRREMTDALASLPAFLSAYTIPPHEHEDSRALQLLGNIFSSGESSRLNRRLVREEQAALAVFANLASRIGPGHFFFGALPNQGVDVAELERLIQDEVDTLKRDGVTERELQKAKNQLLAGQIFGRQSAFSKGSELQHFRLFHGDMDAVNTDLELFNEVTLEDVRRVANKYLNADNRTVIIVTPEA